MCSIPVWAVVILINIFLLEATAFVPVAGKWGHQWKRDAVGRATGIQSPTSLRRHALATKKALMMVEDDDGSPKDQGKGLMNKLLSSFDKPDSGEGNTPIERAGNYVFDLVTVTVGAAVFTCLALNFMGRVPCI